MLVTLTIRTFTPEPTAAALRLGTLAHVLAADGDRVRVLTSRLALSAVSDACRLADGDIDAEEDSGLVEVRHAPVPRDRTGVVRGYVSYMSFDLSLIVRLLAGPRPDAVISEPPSTTGAAVRVACAAHRVPHVYYCADTVPDATALAGMPGFVVRTVAGLESFTLRDVHRIIAVSDGVAHYARNMDAHDVTVVPNGVRVPETVATGTPEGFPACGGPVFVYAGTVAQWLAPKVFVDTLERARARLRDTHLVFVGQGSRRDTLAERSRGMAGVEMAPVVSAEGAGRWMARATAALASLRPDGYDYAYPTKILASLAQSTPVIYVRPGQATRDIAEGELGVACNLNTDEVTEATASPASGAVAWVGAESARAWVSTHRSVEASSRATAAVVQSTLAQAFGFSPSG